MAITLEWEAPRKSKKLIAVLPHISRGGAIRLSEGEIFYHVFCVQLHKGTEHQVIFHR